MKLNDIIHGFEVVNVTELSEINAVSYRMRYLKNGADLVWFDRDDENMTFAISFKTIPEDDTGVFHIIEHSVLCGSEKYPVKEPFVDLLKSSLQTFLNAFTFGDKTMYPVCSENKKDFLNLVDVYLDAVLHPLSISDPHAFRQEGWHYEMDSVDGELRYNGVVFNEMKGAYASPDTKLVADVNRALFPDNCYGFESGGFPPAIPDLSYEQYKACHAKFYHPSNSRIFLDGKVDIEAVLAKIDSFLCEYDKLDIDSDIPMQQPVCPDEIVDYYEIGPDESSENKCILGDAWVVGSFEDRQTALAMSILSDYFCGSNEAPLTKALLDRGLCENAEFINLDSMQQSAVLLSLRNADENKRGEIRELMMSILSEAAEKGLVRKRLEALLNHYEFENREKNYGSMPRGIVYAIITAETWLYGGEPEACMFNEKLLKALREGLDNGLFEDIIRRVFLENKHCAKVCLLPSYTVSEENEKAEAERLEAVRAQWSEEEKQAVVDSFRRFREKQETPDTPEQKATIPQLELSDIKEEITHRKEEVLEHKGLTLLSQDIETNGITYLDLYFNVDDIPVEKIAAAKLMISLLGELATENYSAIDLDSELDSNLGHFETGLDIFSCKGSARPFVKVSVAVLENCKEKAAELVLEVLRRTRFDDEQMIAKFITQARISVEQGCVISGDRIAGGRIGASFCEAGVVSEYASGIESLRWLQSTEKSDIKALCTELTGLRDKVFGVERLTVSITGKPDTEWLDSIVSGLGSSEKGERTEYKLFPVCKEAFRIPAEIGFAAKCSDLGASGDEYEGALAVASQILSLDYLWNEVRVKGGAYGTGANFGTSGGVSFTSYRDPSAAQSLKTFDSCPEALREICAGEESLDSYIISTVGSRQSVLNPRRTGRLHALSYFSGITEEDRQRNRTQIIHTDKESLLRAADMIERAIGKAGCCVVGGKAAIDACGDIFDRIESISAE